jgi:hypothetical protein
VLILDADEGRFRFRRERIHSGRWDRLADRVEDDIIDAETIDEDILKVVIRCYSSEFRVGNLRLYPTFRCCHKVVLTRSLFPRNIADDINTAYCATPAVVTYVWSSR